MRIFTFSIFPQLRNNWKYILWIVSRKLHCVKLIRNIFYEEKILSIDILTLMNEGVAEASVRVVETLALSCMKALHKFASLGIARRWRWSSAFFFPFLLDCLDTPFLATSIPSSILGRAYASLACNSMPGSKIWMHSELEGRRREETLLYCKMRISPPWFLDICAWSSYV